MEAKTLVAQLSQFIAGMDQGDWIALAAFAFSVVSLWISGRRSKAAEQRAEAAEARARKAEDLVRLLGEKETVAFAALKLQDDGLPDKDKDPEHLRLVLRAMMTACVFTSSDRARALLYDVLYHAPAEYRNEIEAAWRIVKQTFDRMETILPEPTTPKKREEDFDLATGRHRLKLVRVVLDAKPPATPASR